MYVSEGESEGVWVGGELMKEELEGFVGIAGLG